MAHVNAAAAKMITIVARLDPEDATALKAWAISEDRSISAQIRIALRGVIPEKFYDDAQIDVSPYDQE